MIKTMVYCTSSGTFEYGLCCEYDVDHVDGYYKFRAAHEDYIRLSAYNIWTGKALWV